MPYSKGEPIHKVYEIDAGTYRISECGFINIYLLVGKERALLIDTGNGAGNISETVKSITNLPLDVVLTHRHCDHIGGAGWFDKVYVHEKDLVNDYDFISSRISSWMTANYYKMSNDLQKQPHRPVTVPMSDGRVFSLGERDIEVLNLPGHTKGSVVLIDDSRKLMFVGDNAGPNLLLDLPSTTTVETWLYSARRIAELSDTHTAYWGHAKGLLPSDRIHEIVSLGEAMLDKYPANLKFPRKVIYPEKNARTFIKCYGNKIHDK